MTAWWWVQVDRNAIADNDRDHGHRPTIVLTSPAGVASWHHTLEGVGRWRLCSQWSHPHPNRPHVWLEVERNDPDGFPTPP